MTVPVRYYCPECETIVTLERAARLADKSVTPYPLEGWSYVDVDEDYETADGIRIECAGCGEPFYLNFVRFENGQEIQPVPASRLIGLAPERPRGPRTPDWPP